MHLCPLRCALIRLSHGQRRVMYRRERHVFGIESSGADQPLAEIGVKKRVYRSRFRTGSGEHDAVSRLPAVDDKQLAGNGLVVALLFLTYAIVIGVLAPTAGSVLIAVKT